MDLLTFSFVYLKNKNKNYLVLQSGFIKEKDKR